MGFLETVGKLLSTFVDSKQQAAMAQYEQEMTMEQIEEMEAKGCDMTEYRAKYAAREAAEKAKEEKLKKDLDRIVLGRLDPFKAVPRDANSPFVLDALKLNDKKANEKNSAAFANASVVYGVVVQAYSPLYDPNEKEDGGLVAVYALDAAHCYDIPFLTKVANKISDLKRGGEIPLDSAKFIKTLRNDQSMFVHKLGNSLSEGADVWCSTVFLEGRAMLPLNYIPCNRVLPFLIFQPPREDYDSGLAFIPPKYYAE